MGARDLTPKERGLLKYLYPDMNPDDLRMRSMQPCRQARAARQKEAKHAAKESV
jgi:hypothetical protein